MVKRGSRPGRVRTPQNERLRRLCREMLKNGAASPKEVASLAGISKALIHAWTKDIDWRKARGRTVRCMWRELRAKVPVR
jgi:DNA invertase Pin-like site-specific DNA recombinase